MKAEPGHLSQGGLMLTKTEKVKRNHGKTFKTTMKLRKLKAPALNWKQKP